MNVVIFWGPPGAGKGSLAQLCRQQLGWKQLSTGNLCRKHIEMGTPIGKEIDFAIKSGKLISDSLISEMVEQWFSQEKDLRGVILDGFPRTVNQAEYLYRLLQSKDRLTLHIIRLFISDEQVIKRLSNRYICQNNDCQQVYSLGNEPLAPKKQMVCDLCESILGRRRDDEQASVKERLQIYYKHEDTLVTFYKKKGFDIGELDSAQPLHEVFSGFQALMDLKVL